MKFVVGVLALLVLAGMFYFFVLAPGNQSGDKIDDTPKTKGVYGF